MASGTTITYPKTGQTLKWPGSPVSFVTFGSAPPGAAISARLIDKLGKTIGISKVLKQAPNWVVYFAEVPEGSDYAIEVLDGDTVNATLSDLKTMGTRAIGIVYPDPNTTVCPTFAAYGNTDQSGSVIGSLVTGATKITGETLQDGPTWVVLFTNVTQKVYDKFAAQIGSSSSTANNITANSSACASVPAS